MGEEMSSWIELSAQKELARRAEIKSFLEAFTAFLKIIGPSIQQELTEFRKHFPHDRVEFNPTPKGGIQVTNSLGGGALASVELKCDAIRRLFIFEFSLSPKYSQAIPAVVKDGSLELDFGQTGATMQTLVEHILMPVLFPGLIADPPVQR